MSIPITVAIVLVSSQNDVPFASAISKATRETLGASAHVVVRDVAVQPTDAEAQAIETAEHADAVAVVVWLDPQRSRASLRVHVEAPPHWIDRELGFGVVDPAIEEGRTIGFAIASMMPEEDVAPRGADGVLPRTSGSVAATSVSSSGFLAPTDFAASTSTEARAPIGSVGALATAAISFGGEGGGVGGGLDARYFLGPHFGVRAGLSARAGDVDKADGRLLTARMTGGIAWRNADGSRAHPFTFGARIDGAAAYLRVTRTVNGASETEARWVPSAEALFEGAWTFNGSASFVVGIGPEALFGSSDVLVNGVRVTEISPLTLVFELGLNAKF